VSPWSKVKRRLVAIINANREPQTLSEIAAKLERGGIFIGGPLRSFENAGRLQISTLLREGLYPYSRVLDIGCGCLRAGYWLVRLLDTGCYFGIEPNAVMLQAGIDHFLGSDLQALKKPSFDTNDRYDYSVFKTEFDVFLARSIWTHAPKAQIQTMLDGFVRFSTPNAFFLTSYCPASWSRRDAADYIGSRWIGRSHVSNKAGLINHKRSWIENECRVRGLVCRQLNDPPFNDQYWLKITNKCPTEHGCSPV
jgi:SAM-dependent methyltransferase